jgi:hypothetical protein
MEVVDENNYAVKESDDDIIWIEYPNSSTIEDDIRVVISIMKSVFNINGYDDIEFHNLSKS